MESLTSIYGSDRRYHSLRIVGTLFTLIGVVSMLIGVLLLGFGISTLFTQANSTPPASDLFAPRQGSAVLFGASSGATITLFCSFAFLLSGLQSVALGALCRLAIQLEENTRASAQFLDRIRRRLESGGEAGEPLFRS